MTSKNIFAGTLGSDTVKGIVTSSNKKLVNVIVSDGFSVVKTNSRGRYEMPFNPAARFIFISVPAGYAFPNEAGIAKHYQALTSKGADYDFKLTPLGKDDNAHNFIIWADPQVKNEDDVKAMLTQSVPDVQKLLSSYESDTLFHGIGAGDLVWDEHHLFASYLSSRAT